MKKSLQAVLALGLGMAMSGWGFAQSGAPGGAPGGGQQGPPPQRDEARGEGRGPGGQGRGMGSPEERMKRMTESLSLTADQQTQIKGFMEAEKKKMDALRDDTSVAADAKREQGMKIRQETQASIRGVLTADQQTKYDKMQSEMRQRGPRGPRPDGQNNSGEKPQDPPPPPPAS